MAKCPICSRPDRGEIDEQLAAGEDPDLIAECAEAEPDALRRHKAHLAPATATAEPEGQAPPGKLNRRQLAFVEHFMSDAKGVGAEAARLAGYSAESAKKTAYDLMRNPAIRAAIDERSKSDPIVANRVELQMFWSESMRDPALEHKDRLKASELLAKSQAVFVERLEAAVVTAEVSRGLSAESIDVIRRQILGIEDGPLTAPPALPPVPETADAGPAPEIIETRELPAAVTVAAAPPFRPMPCVVSTGRGGLLGGLI